MRDLRNPFRCCGAVALVLALLLAGPAALAARAGDVPPQGPLAFKNPPYVDKVEMDPATVRGKAGFYRVGQSKTGQWWFLRPDGTPFICKAACVVGIIPQNAYGEWVKQKYGKDHKRYTEDCIKLLDEEGFNSFGNWSFLFNNDRYYEQCGWPFVENFHARHVDKKYNMTPVMVDAFDPEWAKAYEARCAKRCEELRDNIALLGYFTENEPFWSQAPGDHVWAKTELNAPLALQVFLTADPQRPGCKAAWDFVLARHGNSAEQAAKDWGAAFKTADELREQTQKADKLREALSELDKAAKKTGAARDEAKTAERAKTAQELGALIKKGVYLNSEAYGVDQEAFSLLYSKTFFRVTGEVLRRHDPNHLILGVRHAGGANAHGKAIWGGYDPRYVDVLSHNCYNTSYFYQRVDGYHKLRPDYPILIGEYNWSGGSVNASTAPEKVKAVQASVGAYVQKAFTHPALAGYTWFKYYSGPDPDGQASCGLVTDKGEVNRFNAAILKEINPKLEGLKTGAVQPQKTE